MPDILGLGEIVVDMILKVPHLPEPDEKVDSIYQDSFPGGVTANYVTAVARLGTSAGFIGAVGDDPEGRFLVQDLENENVDTGMTLVKKGKKTPVNYVIVDDKGQKVIVQSPHMLTTKLVLEDVKPEPIMSSKLLHTSAIHPELSILAARVAKRSSVIVSFDLEKQVALRGWEQLKEMVELTDVLLPQKNGAMELVNASSVAEAARILLTKGPNLVVITLGKKGCLVATEKSRKLVPSFKVRAVDTTGAGDAFNGAFTVAYVKGMEPEKAALFANAAAAIKCTGIGARTCMPTRQIVKEFLESNGVRGALPPD
jgi:2-dehydro-3-deoxygluconokinase